MKLYNFRQMRKAKVYNLLKSRYFDILLVVGYCDAACRTGLFCIDTWEEEQKYIQKLKDGLFSVADSVTAKSVVKLT